MLRRLRLHSASGRVASSAPHAGLRVKADDNRRAALIVKRAREKLRPFALIPDTQNPQTLVQYVTQNLGGPDTAGMLLRLSKHEIESDGSLAPATLHLFIAEGEAAFEVLQNVTLNWTVIFSLFMTIYVTLAVMTSGSAAYTTTDEAGLVFASSSTDSAHTGSAWSDFATFAYPSEASSEARATLRRGLYIAECVMICTGFPLCLMGVLNAVMLFSSFGGALADVISKYEFLFASFTPMIFTWITFDGSLFLLPLAVLFAAARASAIMFLGLVVGFCLTFVYMAKIGGPNAYALHILMQQSARRHLALEQATEHEVQG